MGQLCESQLIFWRKTRFCISIKMPPDREIKAVFNSEGFQGRLLLRVKVCILGSKLY